MQHVRVRVTAHGREREIHPVYDLWANASFVGSARALQWNYTEGALGILHYARGDADAFEDAILDYDLERAGEDAFYVYIRDSTTDPLREMFGSLILSAITS